MTIEEIRKARQEAEQAINVILNSLQNQTGARVSFLTAEAQDITANGDPNRRFIIASKIDLDIGLND